MALFANKETVRKAELQRARVRASAAMHAGSGMYNVNPWSFAIGLAGAVFAMLFVLQVLLRERDEGSPATPEPPPASTEIPIELE